MGNGRTGKGTEALERSLAVVSGGDPLKYDSFLDKTKYETYMIALGSYVKGSN